MQSRLSAVTVAILSMVLAVTALGAEPLATITVEAGAYARIDTPVSVSLATVPQAVQGLPLSLQEVKGSERVTIPAQVEQGSTPRLHWILDGTLPAGQTRTYELVPGEARAERVVKATQDDKVLEIRVGDAKVMQYHHAI